MTETKLISRSELAALAGAPEDAVVFWIRQGLLVSTEQQERKHRRFDAREIKIAALLREARKIGLNVGAMRALVDRVRGALMLHDSLPTTDKLGDVIAAAVDRDSGAHGDHIGDLLRLRHITEEQAAAMRSARDAIPAGRTDDAWLALNFVDCEGTLIAYPDGDGWKTTVGPADAAEISSAAFIAFDFARVFSYALGSVD